MEPERISAPDVRDKLINDSALLVCAYDGDPDGHFKIPHLWPGQNPPATE
ncbi:MAG: hypothetical protein HOG03_16220 [Desulfobacula sp.]|mgnify:FL=1|jgi:hypothetical protein|nr:hypothetical protein [Desulfobacula sp.]MBT3806125.1 hypothetical protein [Desulfobacula sp.]MBT4200393.1 hypothetical protein [Desulfobacula sp.]MBT5545495.1 hypothetical protein [Desulfobacula sp.]MBT5972628.1 hypothetical protein [Desulfobacula sp.]